MRLVTSPGLKYPLTVTKVLIEEGGEIQQNDPIFTYRFRAMLREQYNADTGLYDDKEADFFTDFESVLEGIVKSVDVSVGQVIKAPVAVAEIEEPCKHEVQFAGMCANCGKDMNEVTYSTTHTNSERAQINTVHGNTKLLVSQDEANRADDEAKRRLIKSRKLSLVVDLDQTIIHATVDPTVAEWQEDVDNPNHAAVKDVRKFQLVDDGPGGRGTWYYIKLRPGLKDFLDLVSQHYELHIYTMATRAYAEEIANLIDPDHKLFANRILSRDENGSMSVKTLKRLFPVDTKMVVIIDDRGDVWSWSPNLVKVSAYDFFVGIGDINSSFLPKRPELEARPTKPHRAEIEKPAERDGSDTSSGEVKSDGSSKPSRSLTPASTPPAINGDVTAVERMISMAGKQDEGSMKEKSEEQDETIAAQQKDRPLQQMQKKLEDAEKEAQTSPAVEAAAELLVGNGHHDLEPGESTPPSKYRHNLLIDDDNELQHLGESLHNIHSHYFAQYDNLNAAPQDTRITKLRPGGHTKKRSLDTLEQIPDAAVVMADLKSSVLAGVHLVFSGVVPLGVDIHSHDLSVWARSFGATVSDNVGKRTTHLIASPDRRTAKVRQAAKKGGRIAVVSQEWLFACFSQWKRVEVGAYRIHCEAGGSGKGAAALLPDGFERGEFVLSSSDEEAARTEDETDGSVTPTGGAPLLKPLEVNTGDVAGDVEEDWAMHSPTVKREDSSANLEQNPEDWDDIKGELDEFLASGSEAGGDSETESIGTQSTIASDGLRTPPEKMDRKRDYDVAFAADSESAEGSEEDSQLRKRKRGALSRTTSLTKVVDPTSEPAKQVLGEPGGGSTEVAPDDDDGDDDLGAALAAELEADADEG
ncbi:CTD phosphatase Fcp1 [Friedmanniomyces endolithicus]|nr:CTD phosphatase Fcp1 [Friedmanniomyces endolithicus]